MTNEHVNHTLQEVLKPDPALSHLNVFVGKWMTEGLITESPSGPAVKLKAIDTYEWLPGGFFLIHHVDGLIGDKEVKTIEIIGYDASNQVYFTHAYDNHGSMASYYANLLGRDWKITGNTEAVSPWLRPFRVNVTLHSLLRRDRCRKCQSGCTLRPTCAAPPTLVGRLSQETHRCRSRVEIRQQLDC
ncbi:DUF1579 family protein [Brevibacillus porteri]|uniref:DUF1579 domain-containing protein n=1 Tax=Brevibacillus porteri TaxID=2126350 RepID=A0ABX5FMQ0_9BACL|nr:DUF1579 family protein [Brevibacillus porteri]MED1801389.1 DUF1579 family protein [Brevibacillus porteri]MED2132777.1 DUF1579 family protein [Brevibacillus porteri]MED2747760.1 DUF1579 family protein [Brevibacillus porteri]MED2817540.1 DUF1579 family protein [Brevibacillus porteri]MED2895482.1 DUF1579 family protein [Brevibacillus porteri]